MNTKLQDIVYTVVGLVAVVGVVGVVLMLGHFSPVKAPLVRENLSAVLQAPAVFGVLQDFLTGILMCAASFAASYVLGELRSLGRYVLGELRTLGRYVLGAMPRVGRRKSEPS